MDQLLTTFPVPIIHGNFMTKEASLNTSFELFKPQESKCVGFVVLTQSLESVTKLIGKQPKSKVILISQSSNWQIGDYLSSKESQQIVNLLVVADPFLQRTFADKDPVKAFDINLYTHELFIDPMGSSDMRIVTAWRCNHLTRPEVNLFPQKFKRGFNGYRFSVSAAEHPPYVFRRIERTEEDDRVVFDGIEVRLLRLMSTYLNFTINFQEPSISGNNISGYIMNEIYTEKAEVGIGGIFATSNSALNFHVSPCIYEDCAVFLSLTSTALPKYQAIMGPFRWEVWMTLTLTYLLAIFPISFSESHSLTHLLKDPWEIENMFWYVFGTFTNCFTFRGKKSWTSGRRMNSTAIFIGTYWVFSIIITAAYTGSIIAFITIPVFPEVVNNVWQLFYENFRISTVNGSGWDVLFNSSGEKSIQSLFNNIEVVNNIASGIKNVTQSRFLRPYALLESKELLKHIVQTNFTPDSDHKKSLLHISQDCFVRLLVSLLYPKNATHAETFNEIILRALQSGLIMKLSRDIQWDIQRSAKGGLLQASSGRSLRRTSVEDKQLTLDDFQGMFLLLGLGFAIAFFAMFFECAIFHYRKYNRKGQLDVSQVPSIFYTSCDEEFMTKDKSEMSDDYLNYFGSRVEMDDCHTVEINYQYMDSLTQYK
uniref:Ionotropic glutamate receptor C-terminal domain-containing protein n=1 Tax=Clastoptera arizonana TaxID=38151 RepID=A0A1B6E574_9HEMI